MRHRNAVVSRYRNGRGHPRYYFEWNVVFCQQLQFFAAASKQEKEGKVWLVGAGPSDAELLTLKAKRVLEQAEVVV